jgi:hypothetical protein
VNLNARWNIKKNEIMKFNGRIFKETIKVASARSGI